MKKPTFIKLFLLGILLVLCNGATVFAQLAVPFTPRLAGGNMVVKGDVVLIGNNIITAEGLPLPYNGNQNNNNYAGVYVNVASGGDPTIFSSSSADLAISSSCKKILYAGLYWASVYPNEVGTNKNAQFEGTTRFEDWNQMKFKLPTGGWIDIVADSNPDPVGDEDDIIFDGLKYYGPTVAQSFKDSPIICYKNVTNLLAGLADANGTYTAANIRATRGWRVGGCSAGWTLVVLYENPLSTSKYISIFDGYAGVQNNATLNIPVSGFQTLPAPLPVIAKIGVGALEGDIGISGDSFRFKASTNPTFTTISDALSPANNFFNSRITNNGAYITNRNPASLNTLGLDIKNVLIPNPLNSVLPNSATAGDLRLTTSGDGYGAFVSTFAVEIIAPDIVLTKIVEDELGNDIGGQVVDLGDQLYYTIGFKNTGNDDATDFTIRDVLPTNIVFNYPADMSPLPVGVTVQSYNAATRELIFKVDKSVVEQNDPVLEIRFKVTVVSTCSLLSDACSNAVTNQAYATYKGTVNPIFTISDDPSYSSNTGCLITPGATNFLADLNDCIFTEEVIFCGASTVLTAGGGYDAYSWSTSPSGTPVIGTSQSITVTTPGTYYVHNTAVAPCQSIDQVFNVVTFGANVPNPVLPFADQVVTCPNNGKLLPNIFLCGANDSKLIQTNITDASSIIWEKLDEASCAAVTNNDCANENTACTWNRVQTGPNFLADTSGQYRLTLNYAGGCFNQFYFNVFTNLLTPTATSRDIICDTPGEIVVGGVPSGYEYSIDGVNYQPSNVFSVTLPNLYTVYVKQIGVSPNPCIFSVPDVQVRKRNFTVSTVVTQPFCNGGKGSVKLAANDVRPQYFYSIYQGATLINSVGPIVDSDYTFPNLNPGTYTVNVSTEDGCAYSGDIQIIDPPLLTATAALTQPLTCTDGEITVYPVGGTPPYFYFVNSPTDFQTTPDIPVTASGVYNIKVVDVNNCSVDLSITVNAIPPPDFNLDKTDVVCASDTNGTIQVNVTNANGNSLEYSIDNGVTFTSSPLFTGLAAGNYDVVVRYTFATDVCTTASQPITILVPSTIAGTATLTTPYTCTSNGVITASGVSGGTAPYTYSVDGLNFQPGLTFSGLTNGTYTVTIKDANGCTLTVAPITIAPLDPPTDLTFSNTALSCPANNSTVTISSTTGGTLPLQYQITAPAASVTAYQSSNVFSGLVPGTYTFQVRDANNCTYSETYQIMPLPVLSVVGQTISDVTCFGASDGAVRYTVSGTTNFTYTINGGASTAGTSPINLTGLAGGTYTIVIRDNTTNCTATTSATVAAPPAALTISTTVSPLTCSVNGSVVINTTGGWGGNVYELVQPDTTVLGPQGSNIFSNLTQAGTYTARVRDAKGCQVTTTFTINTPTNPTATIVNADYCYDAINGASLEVNATGGQSPYNYSMNGSAFQPSNIFSNLTPGTYNIIVRDAYGCLSNVLTEIIAPQVKLSTVLTKELDCTVSPDAVITGTISDGYTPYTYAVSINGGAYSSLGSTGTPFTYSAAANGTYQFEVTDAKGCQALSNVITISPITNPTATTTTVNPNCNGAANGSVQIVPANGVGPYTFSFNGSAFTSTSSYTGLVAGTYAYVVRDAKMCIFTGSVTLTEPTTLVVTASATAFSCSPTNTKQSATVTINVPTTGTAPYVYSFNGSGYSSSNTLTVNDNGTDQVIAYSVRDANGCTNGGSVTILRLNPPTDLDFVTTSVTCTATTATVTLTATNGVGTLQYETISPSPIVVAKQTSNSFSGLTPGTYVFRVTDANGCYYTESLTINPVIPIAVTGTLISDVLCFGGNNGSGTYTVSGNATVGNYTFVLTAGTLGTGTLTKSGDVLTLSDVVAGTYTVRVTDSATGCFADATITITQPANPLSFTAVATNVNCNEFNSQITVTPAGGTPNYKYAAVIAGSTAPTALQYNTSNVIIVDTNSGANLVWDIYVKDANDCVETNSITIIADDSPTVTATVDNQCSATSGFTITATGSGGVLPYSYSINGGASYQTSATFTVNTAGSYTITIKDANGCTANATAVQVFASITTSAILTKDITCAPAPTDATIDISVSGGNAPYTYKVKIGAGAYGAAISFAGTSFTYTTSTANTYQFEITDANGCIKETNVITTTTPVNPDITGVIQTQFISCNGDETAAIQVTIDNTKGLAPFVINVYNNTTTTDYGTQTSGLAAGNYTITVTDAKGCTDTDAIIITEPSTIIVAHHAEPITCIGAGITKGAVIVDSVTGGTGPYNYFVTGNNGYTGTELNNTGTTSTTFDIVDFGIYQINIVDANGCSVLIQNVKVAAPPDQLDIIVSITADCTIGGSAEVAVGTVLTGAGPFHFAIYTGPGMIYTSPTAFPWQDEDAVGSKKTSFTGLIPGAEYTFIVYDEDTMCYYYQEAGTPVPTNSSLTIDALVSNNVTCTGSADGNVSFDITSIYGVDTDVTYTVRYNQTLVTTGVTGFGTVPANGTLSVPNLGLLDFGNYIIVIEETTGLNIGCSVVTVPFNITESAIDLNISASVSRNENCNELGMISGIASNGTAPYQYQVVATGGSTDPTKWVSTNTFELAAGTYDVYVKDAYGCEKFDTKTIIEDAAPTIDPVALQCFDGSPFTITLSGTTFDGTATYSIGGAYQASPTFTITATNTYTVSIKDANGCIAPTTYVVNPPIGLDVTATELDCVVTPVAFTFSPSGGDGVYTYEVNIDGGGYAAIALPYTTVTPGDYQFRVTDSQTCFAESTVITVAPAAIPTLTYTKTDVSCNGGADGSIVVTAAGGIAPYQYSIDGNPFQISNVFSGLSQGTYSIVIKDSKSCESLPVSVTIDQPTALVVSASVTTEFSCSITNTKQSGEITIDVPTTGSAPYTYSFNGAGYTSSRTLTVIDNGTIQTITYSVKDANGCTLGRTVDILPLNPPTDLDFSANPITCNDPTTDVTLTATNGVGPLSYEIISPIVVGPQASNVFTGLAPDTYVFTVTDANGCYYTESYTVIPVTNITVSGALINDVSCNGGSNGAVSFTVSNFASTYSYTINGGGAITAQTATTINLTGLPIGDQIIIVTDEVTGCTDTVTITVSEPTVLTLVETVNINANCNFGAQVTVEANGGTSPYTYAFVIDGVAPVASDYTSSANAVLYPATSTDWDVWVMDSNGCTNQIDVVIATDTLPTVTVPTFAINQCNLTGDPYTFTVTGTTGIAPFEYSIGNGFQSSPTFTVSTPGTYFVTVRDGNGCTAVSATSITIYPVLDVTASITTLPSCTDDDGVVSVTGSGGSGSYSFSINTGAATVSGNTISGIPSGTYTITITDTVTLCTKDISITLGAATPVTFTTTPTDVSCNGGNDGTITVNLGAGNDNPLYTYQISGPISVGPQNSNIFTGLPAGIYDVTVTSGRNCTLTLQESVGEPNVLTVSGIATDFGCAPDNSVNTSTLTINEVGGTLPYTYSINGTNYFTGNTFDIIDSGSVQTIDIYVKDANGCIATNTVVINPLPTLTAATVAEVTPIDCNGTGSVAISVTGGSGNFTYQMLPSGVPQASNTFSITVPGDYYFQVNDVDTGCYISTAVFTVAPFDTIDVVLTPTTAVTCFGDTNGAMEINVTGYTGAYTYEVFNNLGVSIRGVVSANTATNPQAITGMMAGSYTVVVTETASPFCTTTSNVVTIASPPSALTLVASETSNVTCDNNKGTITATATGGWGTYQYELTGAATVAYSSNGTFTNLAAGNYTVNVRDAGGCIATSSVTLNIPVPITATVTANATLLTCFGDTNATITATAVSGGQGMNYSYTLNMVAPTATSSGPQSSAVFTGLGVGTYNVTITDGYNCSFTSSPDIIITELPKVEATLAKVTSQTCLTGTELNLSATGGTGIYEYSANATFSPSLGTFASSVTINLAPGVSGTYQYYVRDANGCVANVSNQIKVDPLPPLTIVLDLSNAKINCTGDTNGVIIAKAQGGLGNYVYVLQNTLGNPIPATQNSPGVFTNLPAGSYQVMVTSGDCVTTTSVIIIAEPINPLTVGYNAVNVVCAGSNNGSLQINATGGTGIIKYAISPRLDQFFEKSLFENLAPGNYQAIAQDEKGCFVIIDFNITEPAPVFLTIVPGSFLPEVCEGDLDGEFSVDISGGTLPYSVALDNINGTYTTGAPTQTQFDFTGLSGGDHTVFVRDAVGCESEWNITFPKSVKINPIAVVTYGCIDNNSTNMVTVTVDASITNLSDLDYSLDGAPYQASNIFTNVAPGLGHYIDVRHTNGCIKRTNTFDIAAYTPLAVMLDSGTGINEIVAVTTGGSGGYQYTFNGEDTGSNNSYIIYRSGDYTVTVTDSNGCTATATKYFEYVDVCIPNYFTPNGDLQNDTWGPGCSDQYKDLTFDIFDRYGRKIATYRLGETWDGTYRGRELPSGDYWYTVHLNDKKDNRSFVGHFTLYR
ncbi:T9SS type B sorting domain-containing protein [Mariniflexile sp.]|uniref:T9SS type B sorting domain-containing protein n=2 Tax=Mariniflexile sp. TaxID=1979402 RepID=UPI004047CB9F